MELKVKKMHPEARLPTYGSEGAACFDLYAFGAAEIEGLHGQGEWKSCRFASGSAFTFRTGLAFEVPLGWVLKIYSRSGHGFKNDIRLANCVGVIDSDYRGEVMVKLTNDSFTSFEVKCGDRIAQAMLEPVERVTFCEVAELSETARGAGGFGSTGN